MSDLFSKHRHKLKDRSLHYGTPDNDLKPHVKAGSAIIEENEWLYHKLKIMNSSLYNNQYVNAGEEERMGVFQPKDGTLQYLTIAPESGVSATVMLSCIYLNKRHICRVPD